MTMTTSMMSKRPQPVAAISSSGCAGQERGAGTETGPRGANTEKEEVGSVPATGRSARQPGGLGKNPWKGWPTKYTRETRLIQGTKLEVKLARDAGRK